ncbi:hypothetical protein EJB05_11260, partial [Eragrostis curvula]
MGKDYESISVKCNYLFHGNLMVDVMLQNARIKEAWALDKLWLGVHGGDAGEVSSSQVPAICANIIYRYANLGATVNHCIGTDLWAAMKPTSNSGILSIIKRLVPLAWWSYLLSRSGLETKMEMGIRLGLWRLGMVPPRRNSASTHKVRPNWSAHITVLSASGKQSTFHWSLRARKVKVGALI